MGVPITDESHVVTITSADSPYSVTLWDRLIIIDCAGGPVTINLPSVVDVIPKRYDFKKIDATANAATITPFGSDTIDGAASRVLTLQWQTFGSTATAVGWTVNYLPMNLAADGESSSVKATAANDGMLSNARTPTAHATSHEDAGADPLRGTIKVDGIEATAVPNTLGPSVNTGNVTFDPGKGTVIRSPNGHRWQIVVTNSGALGANDLDA